MAEQKILILELGGIGDTAMSIPAVRAVLNSYRNAHITVLTVPRTRAIIESLKAEGPGNLDVVSTDAMEKSRVNGWSSLIKTMRRERYDIAIDLSAVETFKAAVKRWLFFTTLGVTKTFGRNTNGRGWGFSKKSDDVLTSDEHEVLRKIKVVELLGIKAERTAPRLTVPDHDKEYADAILSEWTGRLIVGINPGAFRPSRTWPAGRFKDIAMWLIEEMSAHVVITGGDKEKAVVESIAESLPGDRVKTVTGVSIMKFGAVIERMNIFMTNDTGPMHVAAAVGVPTVALFGQTNLYRYHPYMDDSMYITIKKECSICPCSSFEHPMEECRKHDCDDKQCMDSITMDEVIEAAEKLLSKQNAGALV
jgi:ADP-heptose:LPS heptosyltransferase